MKPNMSQMNYLIRGVFSGEFDPLVFSANFLRAVRDELDLSENCLFLEVFHLFTPKNTQIRLF